MFQSSSSPDPFLHPDQSWHQQVKELIAALEEDVDRDVREIIQPASEENSVQDIWNFGYEGHVHGHVCVPSWECKSTMKHNNSRRRLGCAKLELWPQSLLNAPHKCLNVCRTTQVTHRLLPHVPWHCSARTGRSNPEHRWRDLESPFAKNFNLRFYRILLFEWCPIKGLYVCERFQIFDCAFRLNAFLSSSPFLSWVLPTFCLPFRNSTFSIFCDCFFPIVATANFFLHVHLTSTFLAMRWDWLTGCIRISAWNERDLRVFIEHLFFLFVSSAGL